MSGFGLDVISVAGARPNFMKVAPLARAFEAYPGIRHRLVHTGQHYDEAMSALFFEELGIPRPWRNLEVGSGGHAVQTARIMERFDAVLEEEPADVVVVVGDVNSTIACALTAVKRGIPVAHVEAGLRSFDRSMPEEINRMLTDAISDVLLVSEPSGVENLRREGVDDARVFLTGNVMIDTLLACRERAAGSDVRERLGLEPKAYGLVTLHRPANVDDPASLRGLVAALEDVAERLPLVFPVHPRTRGRLEDAGVRSGSGLRLVEPLGYVDFLALMEGALLILTDSGGIQEEACILQVPCLTLRENTERPITIEVGLNRLVGTDPDRVRSEALRILDAPPRRGPAPELWDGKAAERIARILWERYGPAKHEGGERP